MLCIDAIYVVYEAIWKDFCFGFLKEKKMIFFNKIQFLAFLLLQVTIFFILFWFILYFIHHVHFCWWFFHYLIVFCILNLIFWFFQFSYHHLLNYSKHLFLRQQVCILFSFFTHYMIERMIIWILENMLLIILKVPALMK